MTRLPENLTKADYLVAAGKTALTRMPEDTLLPGSFLTRYCGWTPEDVKALTPAEEKTNRFGPLGPKSVKGYPLSAVMKAERTKAFRARHAHPLHITESRLKSEHFFTDGLLRKWLGEPDLLTDNPHYKSGPPMRLHRIGKILLLRSVPKVEADLAKVADQREARSASARAAAARKRDAWIAAFDKVEVRYRFPKTYAKVEAAAMGREGMGQKSWAAVDIGTRVRWTVNMLRHEFTDYDQILALDLPPGRAGEVCYRAVKTRILGKIAETYPELADEAHRQMWA